MVCDLKSKPIGQNGGGRHFVSAHISFVRQDGLGVSSLTVQRHEAVDSVPHFVSAANTVPLVNYNTRKVPANGQGEFKLVLSRHVQ